MMYLMSKYNHVYSWGSKYKIYHYDLCRKQTSTKMILNSATDYRASSRKDEHIDIPAFQDWEYLLKNKIAPDYRKTWIKCFKEDKIFYFSCV
jgi:hypothetical protein